MLRLMHESDLLNWERDALKLDDDHSSWRLFMEAFRLTSTNLLTGIDPPASLAIDIERIPTGYQMQADAWTET